MKTFRAFRIHDENKKIVARFENLSLDDLAPGDVLVRVTHSALIIRTRSQRPAPARSSGATRSSAALISPASVESSSDARFAPERRYWSPAARRLSETHDGGYAEYARVPGDWVIAMPKGLDARAAMSFLGTAGFTAALAIHLMERQRAGASAGPIAVTGASGGVGKHCHRHARGSRL